jgi:hypothetical protein
MAVRPEAARTPLQKGICRIRSDMMFKYAFDLRADRDILHWIAEQVANHAYSASVRDFYKYSEVGTRSAKRRVRGMPDPLPAEDPAKGFDLSPLRIKGVAVMAYPLGPKLPGVTMGAALHQQPALT